MTAASTETAETAARQTVRHLYIHVPFCAKICPYCAFYVHRGGIEARRAYVAALLREIAWARSAFDLQPETIYLGGGTPSLLAADMVAEIFAALPPASREVTMEVNPATVTEEKARAWKRAGIGRISLGAQSFDPAFLKLLGRDHTPEEVAETAALLRAEGFANLNVDLMYALPGQPREVWTETLRRALALRPDHISSYGLTYEEDTPFFERLQKGEWRTDEEREIAMFDETFETLAAAGLPFYEVSNFARPGCESAHNRAYWAGADYVGLGPGAYSTVGTERWFNLKDTTRYGELLAAGKTVIGEREALTPETKRRERILLGLRTREGVERSLLDDCERPVATAVDEGLAAWNADRLILTARGRRVADGVAGLFV